MYKRNSQSLQRAHGVHRIMSNALGMGDSIITSLDDMTLAQAVDEKSRLQFELARCENDLLAAKRAKHKREAKEAGRRKGAIEHRIGALNDLIKQSRRQSASNQWRQAIQEVCPEKADAIEAKFCELSAGGHG